MDEFVSLVLQGIKLAKDLEPSLQNLASQQEMVSKLDDIIRIFITARETLNSQDPSSFPQMLPDPPQIDPSLQEYWLRTKMMELFQTQMMERSNKAPAGGIQMGSSSSGDLAMELGPSRDVQAMEQRPRRRRDDPERRTMRVPAPRMGNTEIPPEDGYTWRKYGQKEILGSKFPRGYYRCTHQKLYQCPAKKQVQRLDRDPYTFEVTYRGYHTCHVSATAPSGPPPPPPQITQEMAQHHQQPPPWLEFSLGGPISMVAAGGGGGGCSGAGPSRTVHYDKEIDYPVADMADVMFNSGSSSSNSMELIFNSMEGKKESGDDKKN